LEKKKRGKKSSLALEKTRPFAQGGVSQGDLGRDHDQSTNKCRVFARAGTYGLPRKKNSKKKREGKAKANPAVRKRVNPLQELAGAS